MLKWFCVAYIAICLFNMVFSVHLLISELSVAGALSDAIHQVVSQIVLIVEADARFADADVMYLIRDFQISAIMGVLFILCLLGNLFRTDWAFRLTCCLICLYPVALMFTLQYGDGRVGINFLLDYQRTIAEFLISFLAVMIIVPYLTLAPGRRP